MRALSNFFSAAALSLLASGAAWAGAAVTFVEPDKFADVPFSPIEREQVLKELSDYFVKLGARLPPDQTLKIEVTEVDLAGRMQYSRRANQEIRLLTGGADWPRMQLRYQLLEPDGKVLRAGQDDLSDMTYLNHMHFHSVTESLRYEKEMIDDWFFKTFGVRARG